MEKETVYQCLVKNCGERCERKKEHIHKTERCHRTNRFGCPACQPIPSSPAPRSLEDEIDDLNRDDAKHTAVLGNWVCSTCGKAINKWREINAHLCIHPIVLREITETTPSNKEPQVENFYKHIQTSYGKEFDKATGECIRTEIGCFSDCPACAFEAGKVSRIPTAKEIENILYKYWGTHKTAAAIVALIEGKE